MTQSTKPIRIECRHAFYAKSKISTDDIHVVKQILHYEGGRQIPHLRIIKNFKRKFGVTKVGQRNHESKKEWEKLENLDIFECTQSQLVPAVARALKMPWFRGSLRDLSASPYLYGTEIDSTALIKQYYIDAYPGAATPYSVAVFDVETDVIDNPEIKEIIMATISFRRNAYTAVQKKVLRRYSDNIEDAIAKIKEIAAEKIGDILKERGVNWVIEAFDTEIEVVKKTIDKAHLWKPDFLSAWNVLFDISRVQDACKRAGVNPADILNDPSVPEEYRHFRIKEGATQKVTASNVFKPLKISEQWHYVFSPASFVWIDSMCVYRQVRAGQQEEPRYDLDSIARKTTKLTKLKDKICDHLKGLAWHREMQSKHILFYTVYNLFDCILVELHDEKTNDLRLTLPNFAGCSDFSRFNSQPSRKVDKLHHYCLKNNWMIASRASEMADKYDKLTTSLKGWITMLPSHPIVNNGLQCLTENPYQRTTYRMGVYDLDVSAAYPTNQIVMNISKRTTRFELVYIDGVAKYTMRMNTINFSAGHVNALEFCQDIFGMPTLEEMRQAYRAEQEGVEFIRAVRQRAANAFMEEPIDELPIDEANEELEIED